MPSRIDLIKEIILHGILVPKCTACGEPLARGARALCNSCMIKYAEVKTRNCSRCAKVYSKCSCTNEYLSRHFIKGLAKLYPYRNAEEFRVTNEIIYKLKRKARQDVVDFISDELSDAIIASLPPLGIDTIVTNVPNKAKTIKRRGFDQAEVIARAVADKLGLVYMPLLRSLAKKQQKQLKGHDRIKNAQFDILSEEDLSGKNLLIIDDVVTTGASMGNSATILRSLHPKAIYGATIGVASTYEIGTKSNKIK